MTSQPRSRPAASARAHQARRPARGRAPPGTVATHQTLQSPSWSWVTTDAAGRPSTCAMYTWAGSSGPAAQHPLERVARAVGQVVDQPEVLGARLAGRARDRARGAARRRSRSAIIALGVGVEHVAGVGERLAGPLVVLGRPHGPGLHAGLVVQPRELVERGDQLVLGLVDDRVRQRALGHRRRHAGDHAVELHDAPAVGRGRHRAEEHAHALEHALPGGLRRAMPRSYGP